MKKLRIIGVLAALLIVMTALASCNKLSVDDVKTDPLKYLSDGMVLTLDGTPLANLSGSAEKGSYQFTFNGENASADMKMYLDTASAKGALELEAKVPSDYEVDETTGEFVTTGSQIIALDAYYADKNIVVKSDLLTEYIGTDALGFNIAMTKEDFEASALYDALLSLSGATEEDVSEEDVYFSNNIEEVAKALNDYITACTELGKNAYEFGEIAEETIEIDGKKVKTIVIPFTVKEDIYSSLFDEAVNMIVTIYKSNGAELTEEDITAMKEEMNSSMPDIKLSGSYYLSAKTGAVVKFTEEMGFTLPSGDETMNIKLTSDTVYGADPTTAFLPSINMKIDVDGDKLTVNGKSSVADGKFVFDGEAKYDAKVDEEDDSGTFRFELSPDGKFTLTLTDDEDEFVIPGTFTSDETKTELSIDLSSMYEEDEVAEITDIKIVITAGEEVPALPEYKNILDMTEEDLASIMSLLGTSNDMNDYTMTAEDYYYVLTAYYYDQAELDAALDAYADQGYATRDDMIYDVYIGVVMEELLAYMDEATITNYVSILVNEGYTYQEIADTLDQLLWNYYLTDTEY